MNCLIKLFLPVLLILFCVGTSEGRKLKLHLRPPAEANSPVSAGQIEVTADSVASAPYTLGMITFSGYDKEPQANVESFFITNNTDRVLKSLTLVIYYRTLDGRPLHSRRVTVEPDTSPGTTVRVNIKTWDRQHTFYYHRGNRPRKKATPYEVAFHVESFILTL
ncbi:MAG: hypothetical protein K2H75_08985 [Muribaculaceae bacterium]|nr:hypothetical protein [Muribaculaceae bacterium]